MTREEAIKYLKEMKDECNDTIHKVRYVTQEEALEMAIKALEQEPCGDLISRQAVMDCFKKWQPYMATRLWNFEQELSNLPSVNPQEPKYCDRNICIKNEYNGIGCDECEVTKSQEPKTGHWIKSNITNEKYVCSECGGGCWYYDYQADVAKSRFCPNCGARMVKPQESED